MRGAVTGLVLVAALAACDSSPSTDTGSGTNTKGTVTPPKSYEPPACGGTSESFTNAAIFSSGTGTVLNSEPKPPRGCPSGGKLADFALVRGGCFNLTSLITAPTLTAARSRAAAFDHTSGKGGASPSASAAAAAGAAAAAAAAMPHARWQRWQRRSSVAALVPSTNPREGSGALAQARECGARGQVPH